MNARKILDLKDGTGIFEKVIDVKVAEDDTGQIITLSSTNAVDSDDDIIHQAANAKGGGWDLDRFNKHPTMLWAHNPFVPSLGTGSAKVMKSDLGDGLHFFPVFDQADEFARQIEGKVRRGVLSETSVGFASNNFSRRTDSDSDWPGYEFFDSELIEISWVNRGANPDVDASIKGLLKTLPGLFGKVESFADPALEEIRKDLMDRYAEMEKRLRVIEDSIVLGGAQAVEPDKSIDEMIKIWLDQ